MSNGNSIWKELGEDVRPTLLIEKAAQKLGRKKRYLNLYRCKCGKEFLARSDHVNRGESTTCGCSRFVHGMGETQTYHAWESMKKRCDNPNSSNYVYYGAKGISYDPRWKFFENFLEDMGIATSESLDRIDASKDYSKENCRWVTLSENAREAAVRRWLNVKNS